MSLLHDRISRLICTMLLGAAGFAVPAYGAVLSTTVSTPAATTGQLFSMDVIVSGLSAGQTVGGFDLDLLFDAGLLNPIEVTFGDALGVVDADQFTSTVTSPGRIDFAAVSLLNEAALQALQTDSFALAHFVFQAIGPGTATFSFDTAPPGLLLSDQSGNAITLAGISGATIVLSAPTGSVPEPGSLSLLVAAALLAPWQRRARAGRA